MGHKLFALPPNERYILLAVIVLIWLIVRGIQLFSSRNKLNTPLGAHRNYGVGGGSVCPKCHRPFPLSFFEVKVGFGTKFTLCPYCGRLGLFQRLGLEELRLAEAAELAEAQPAQPIRQKSEAEKTQELLDESRFTDRS